MGGVALPEIAVLFHYKYEDVVASLAFFYFTDAGLIGESRFEVHDGDVIGQVTGFDFDFRQSRMLKQFFQAIVVRFEDVGAVVPPQAGDVDKLSIFHKQGRQLFGITLVPGFDEDFGDVFGLGEGGVGHGDKMLIIIIKNNIFVDKKQHMGSKKQILFPKHQKILEQLGENIKLARKRRNLTTIQVSERANIDRTTLYYIEKGKSSVSIGAYFNVLRVLGLHNDFLKLAADDELGRKLQDLKLLKNK